MNTSNTHQNDLQVKSDDALARESLRQQHGIIDESTDWKREACRYQAELATEREVSAASNRSRANLLAYAQNPTPENWASLTMSGHDLAIRDVITTLSQKLERLKECIWPGLPAWTPTPEQPKQDFYEAIIEGFRAELAATSNSTITRDDLVAAMEVARGYAETLRDSIVEAEAVGGEISTMRRQDRKDVAKIDADIAQINDAISKTRAKLAMYEAAPDLLAALQSARAIVARDWANGHTIQTAQAFATETLAQIDHALAIATIGGGK